MEYEEEEDMDTREDEVTNLVDETKSKLDDIKKTPHDIKWIGSSDGEYSMTWDEFLVVGNVNYDNGSGGQEIAGDLIIVFNDNTWLSRHQYDGSEWWRYNSVHVTKGSKKIHRLKRERGYYIARISDLNGPIDNE